MGPTLFAFVDGVEVARLVPPALSSGPGGPRGPSGPGGPGGIDTWPRSWLLGVMAVQATVEEGVAVARLRVNMTGAEPRVISLGERAMVTIALAEEAPVLDVLNIVGTRKSAARLSSQEIAAIELSIDDIEVARAGLDRARLGERPPPRAFSHVFCRWLRDGGREPGCDLTAFLSIPEGVKYERIASRVIDLDQIIDIRWARRT